jgi:hypothetical protein
VFEEIATAMGARGAWRGPGRGAWHRGGPGEESGGRFAGGRGGRGPGREGGQPPTQGLAGWLAGRLPTDWFTGPVDLVVDRDEVTVVGDLPPLEPAVADPAERAEAEAGRITRFRESTRPERIAIAQEIEQRWGRTVAWGARVGDRSEVFTRASVPTMTRLRQPERVVLDTLVDAGVARSRSDALAWCVRLVGEHTEDWLASLREALRTVEEVRDAGPGARGPAGGQPAG